MRGLSPRPYAYGAHALPAELKRLAAQAHQAMPTWRGKALHVNRQVRIQVEYTLGDMQRTELISAMAITKLRYPKTQDITAATAVRRAPNVAAT